MKKLTQTGDTIVEVMLAMAVLASVIGGSYAIASRSLIQSQQAQERMVATKLAEGQIDRLKYLAGSDANTFRDIKDALTASNSQCITTGASPPYAITRNANNPGDNTNTCWTIGDPTGLYDVYLVNYTGAPLEQFTIRVEWDSFRSETKNNVTMVYRVQ